MPQTDGPRLEARDREILARNLCGVSQLKLAEEFGISQQRISQIIADELDGLAEADRKRMATADLFRSEILLNTFVQQAVDHKDTKAAAVVVRVLERRAKMLGYDAPEPLSVTVSRGTDVAGGLVSSALVAGIQGLLSAAPGLPPQSQKELGDYAMALAVRELLSAGGDSEDELPPAPDMPVWPTPKAPDDDEDDLDDDALADLLRRAHEILDQGPEGTK